MKFSIRDAVEFLFLPVMTAGVFVLWDMNKSVGLLNVQVGVLIEKNGAADEKVKSLERRIERIEDQLNKATKEVK